jgi:uncharacterized SAM-binding protein YcdF (DUF218 family)
MKKLLLYALIVFFFFSNSFIVDEIMRPWEIRTRFNEIKKRKYDYGIVLGGIMNGYVYATEQIIFNRSVDRLMQAIVLYRQGVIEKIVFTGGSGSVIEKDMKEGIFVKNYLLSIGIPDSCLIMEWESRNTYENAVYTKELIGAGNERCDLLITSGSHMRRSLAIFRKQGFCVDPFSADLNAGVRKYDPSHLLMPSYRAMEEWGQLLHEWTGMLAYKIKGYL